MKRTKDNKITKLFLVLFCICLVVWDLAICNVQATDNSISWDRYKADYYLDYSPYEYYMSDEFNIPYRTIVEENSNSLAFNTLLAGWEVTTFELSNALEYSKKRVGYYETFLFDILYQGSDMDVLSDKLNSCVKSTQASTLKQVCSFLEESELSYAKTNIASMSSEEKENLAEGLVQCDEFKEIFGAISDVSKVLSYASDVEELIYKLAKASVIMGMSEEYGDVLIQVASNTNDVSMQAACNELAAICHGEISETELLLILSSDKVSDGTLWEAQTALYFRGFCRPYCAVL